MLADIAAAAAAGVCVCVCVCVREVGVNVVQTKFSKQDVQRDKDFL